MIKTKIAELKQLIKNANSEINSLAAAIGGLSVALAASIAISVIAVAAAGPFGMVTWIFTGAIIATSIAFIAIDSLENSYAESKDQGQSGKYG